MASGKGKSSGLMDEDRCPFILVRQIVFSLPHIEGITLGADEEQVAWVWLGTRQVKDKLLGCMGQVLQ